jgi:hypothetical protein
MRIGVDAVHMLAELGARGVDRQQAQTPLRFELLGLVFDVLALDARALSANLVLLDEFGGRFSMLGCAALAQVLFHRIERRDHAFGVRLRGLRLGQCGLALLNS